MALDNDEITPKYHAQAAVSGNGGREIKPATSGDNMAHRTVIAIAGVVLFVGSIAVALVAGELAIRSIDGYSLRSLVLTGGPTPSKTHTIGHYIADLPLAQGMRREWVDLVPPPLPRTPIDPRFARAAEDATRQSGLPNFEFAHVYNNRYVEKYVCNPAYVFKKTPGYLFVFDPVDGSEYPRYRFPRSMQTPTGLQTNAFGWRGADLAFEKPEHAIRIAFVGASTTADPHGAPFSYPELVGFYLNKWAEANALGARFEIINAGREGINSTDIAAVARTEVLPMAPDYIVYYEGSNQFLLGSLAPSVITDPSHGLPPVWTTEATEYSAVARRFRELLYARTAEPAKPDYAVEWPSAINEFDPQLERDDLPSNLSTILHDLEDIRKGADAAGAHFVVSSFFWLVWDGMRINRIANNGPFTYLNKVFYPYRYKDMARLAAFQNRVFQKYANVHDLPFIDVAGQMPHDPYLFFDAIHTVYDGSRIRAWIAAQRLADVMGPALRAGTFVPTRQSPGSVHPAFRETDRTIAFSCVEGHPEIKSLGSGIILPTMSIRTAYELHALDFKPNWMIVGTDNSAQIVGQKLIVKSSSAMNANEWTTDPFVTIPNNVYFVRYNLKVSEGSIALGVLDTVSDKWVVVKVINEPDGILWFTAPTNKMQLLIAKNSTAPTAVTIERLEVVNEPLSKPQ